MYVCGVFCVVGCERDVCGMGVCCTVCGVYVVYLCVCMYMIWCVHVCVVCVEWRVHKVYVWYRFCIWYGMCLVCGSSI